MFDTQSKRLIFLGRILIAIYFLLPGIAKFFTFDAHLDMMVHHAVPFAGPLLAVAAVSNILGGGLVLINKHVRLACYGLMAYTLIVTLLMHDFWNFTGIEAAHEAQNFAKNIGVFAAIAMLAGISPPVSGSGR